MEADPSNAHAWCGLADSYLMLYEYADLPTDEALRETRSAITAAQVLQPDLAEAEALIGDALPRDPGNTVLPMRPWDMTLVLGERANHVALLGVDHLRRAAILGGLKAQLAHMRAGGVRLPALDYHSAVLCALDDGHGAGLHWLDQALEAGFADAMAFRRELVWQHFADPEAERNERMQSRLASERLRIEATERSP